MEARWMAVFEDMTWYDAELTCEGEVCELYIYNKKQKIKTKKIKENEFTKVVRLQDRMSGDTIDLVDFNEMDRFFEQNMVIFKNRQGLHKEVRRYIDFSLK
ncbi:hypothetical protein [Seleniivibrio woodruffii]|uniref:Uncharacterized protein n=1 Tax=Seleniivibrio woodruffii TaxID=1078050 RepID=A0A4R1KES1_9BACT|nr:hypothetical protein [Seleniivibrio woodruffii]TCK62647.1 hypothetical protein C8D98_1181 [Seleniivibrio woodruffii]TVZ36927.1 hypothetical protein OF66_2568 [Seleniivibrio woodruffii]